MLIEILCGPTCVRVCVRQAVCHSSVTLSSVVVRVFTLVIYEYNRTFLSGASECFV